MRKVEKTLSLLKSLIGSTLKAPAPYLDGRKVYVIGCVDPRYTRFITDYFRTLAGGDGDFLGYYPEIGGSLRFCEDSLSWAIHIERIEALSRPDFFGPAIDVWHTFHQPDCKWCDHREPKVSFTDALQLQVQAQTILSDRVPEGVRVKTGLLVDWKDDSLGMFELDAESLSNLRITVPSAAVADAL